MHWILVLVLLLPVGIWAQGTEKGEQKEDGYYLYHYFNSGEISSLNVTRKAGQLGYAVAYDRAGREIYRHETGMKNGSQSVRFKYYESGAVRAAIYHWQPDGGIQSGGNTTEFAEDGRVTSVKEELTPFKMKELLEGPAKKPDQPQVRQNPPQKEFPKQEIVEESPIYHTEYFFVNRARKPVKVLVKDKFSGNAAANTDEPREIAPGDTLRGGNYINAGMHRSPCEACRFELVTRKNGWLKKMAIRCDDQVFVDLGPEHRKYYFFVEKK
ncbi:MAG: hypothetical protein H6581_04495 [Bacteroidia bacterium]|nr:hypothetical protein [Bacteroidia bacterium]